jgi:hypothetical protein
MTEMIEFVPVQPNRGGLILKQLFGRLIPTADTEIQRIDLFQFKETKFLAV